MPGEFYEWRAERFAHHRSRFHLIVLKHRFSGNIHDGHDGLGTWVERVEHALALCGMLNRAEFGQCLFESRHSGVGISWILHYGPCGWPACRTIHTRATTIMQPIILTKCFRSREETMWPPARGLSCVPLRLRMRQVRFRLRYWLSTIQGRRGTTRLSM